MKKRGRSTKRRVAGTESGHLTPPGVNGVSHHPADSSPQVSINTPADSSAFPSPQQVKSEEDNSESYCNTSTAKRGKTAKNLNNCGSAEFKDWSTSAAMVLLDHEKTTTANLHQTPGPAEKSHITCNGQEQYDNDIDPKIEPTQSPSLDVTKMAAMSNDDSSDPDEVGSAFDSDLVTVNGYKVKEEFASLLGDIFAKYGDLAKCSTIQSVTFRSSCLEMLCGIYQKLEETKFEDVTSGELKFMLDRIVDIQLERLEVGWLGKRLLEINDAKLVLKGSSFLKEAKTRNHEAMAKIEKELEGYKEEMVLLIEKISLTEEKLAAVKAETQTINQRALDMKAKVKYFYQRSLVDGLL